MNDLFGLAPNAYTTARELRLLVGSFGPQSSKYIVTFPQYQDWYKRLLGEFENSGDIERERIKTVLNRAKLNHALIDRKNLPWNATASWTENAIKVWKTGGDYKKIYVSDDEHEAIMSNSTSDLCSILISASESEPFSASDEQIDTTPQSYWRASRLLCSMSRDIHFVDPYLNPLKRDFGGVFTFFLQELCKIARIDSINFWVREKTISEHYGDSSISSIKELISKNICHASQKLAVNFHLLRDETATDKLHARYLLTECGGIRFDQGFQKLPEGRTNMVSPIGVDLHQSLYQKYSLRKFDLRISSSIFIESN